MTLNDAIRWDSNGLVAVIVQDETSQRVLMFAWMNQEALRLTLDTQEAVYWSRSRSKLWRKGEESGHIQQVQALYLDCDGDCLLLMVKQTGGIACHTGRVSCFFRQQKGDNWRTIDTVLKSPQEIYRHE